MSSAYIDNMYIQFDSLKEDGINRLGLYLVKAGDSIQSICKRFQLPPVALICSNNLKAEPEPESMLVLPKCSGKIYTVQVGESIESLCRKFDITREEFIQKNSCTYVYPSLVVML